MAREAHRKASKPLAPAASIGDFQKSRVSGLGLTFKSQGFLLEISHSDYLILLTYIRSSLDKLSNLYTIIKTTRNSPRVSFDKLLKSYALKPKSCQPQTFKPFTPETLNLLDEQARRP